MILLAIKESNARVILTMPNKLKDMIKQSADKENRSISNYVVNLLKKTVAYEDDKK